MNIFALNSLGKVDIIFFIVIALVIGLCIGIYFLIPVINKEQYEQARKNLYEREKAFRRNTSTNKEEKK